MTSYFSFSGKHISQLYFNMCCLPDIYADITPAYVNFNKHLNGILWIMNHKFSYYYIISSSQQLGK